MAEEHTLKEYSIPSSDEPCTIIVYPTVGDFDNPELLKNKSIWSRRSIILPEFVDSHVKIYNGKTFICCKITEGKVGHKFGEFALTRKRKSRTNLMPESNN
ncbi:ribosomal protein S19 [Medicago truncatula]|uniref:Ribosomal protein S19 n=1 Tax=Medicago truncatula TaxID=3880 RepID=A0A072TQI8_MEDTR|nr:ribosomal protein S19 [Medicago truncatula]